MHLQICNVFLTFFVINRSQTELQSTYVFVLMVYFVVFDAKKCVVVVITPPLPRDGGTARTAIRVHAVNLIETRLGERWQLISNHS